MWLEKGEEMTWAKLLLKHPIEFLFWCSIGMVAAYLFTLLV